MKFNKILYAAALASALTVSTTSCSDDYAELNQSPANVTKTDPQGLMAAAILQFQPADYLIWYYNISYFTRWTQLGGGNFDDRFTEQNENGGQGSQYIATMKYRNDIRAYINNNGDETQRGYEAACEVLTVYLGIFDSDMYGALPYSKACRYDEGILTPKYDTVEQLYDIFIEELDQAIAYFQIPDIKSNPSQDPVYSGDWKKWAKLANSLKLKVAVRLYNNDPAKAKKIAEDVVNSSVGYLDSMDDDMRFCKATEGKYNANQDNVYGTGNGLSAPTLTQNVANFLKGSLDPRIRFIFTKNSFNSKVVQGFLDQGLYDKLPTWVKQDAQIDTDKDGKKTFVKWNGMGEPWVRYQGYPVVYDRANDPAYAEYFNPGTRYQLTVDEATKGYSPFSAQSEEMKRGRVDFTVPTVGKTVIQDTDDNPLYQMYMTAAETNLYLAEFKLLGANLPKSAEYYYNRGVEMSVETYDALAKANKIPYYGTTYDYDKNEKKIDLEKGELEAMMNTENVKLIGTTADQLEKVYLQQLVHFYLQPDDQFVTARRSGYPKIDSRLLPFIKFDQVALEAIPRRFQISSPSPTDKMYQQKLDIYKLQGFTTGTSQSGPVYNQTGTVLNTERLWQDKNAPQWGTPK